MRTLLDRIDALEQEIENVRTLARDEEKRASVLFAGTLQATSTGHLMLSVPSSLVQGLHGALDAPGVSLPHAPGGAPARVGIVVMTPAELSRIGGPNVVTERGRTFRYSLGSIEESPAVGWPGVSTCWHIRVVSPELAQLRKTYGLHPKLESVSDFSIVIGCRRTGVLTRSGVSKLVTAEEQPPEWVRKLRDRFLQQKQGDPWFEQQADVFDANAFVPGCFMALLRKTAAERWYLATSEIQGEGIFAAKDFEKDERIGEAAHRDGEDDFGNAIWDLTLMGRKCNHQTRANSTLVVEDGSSYLIASQPIAEDDEIVSDYRQVGQALGSKAVFRWEGKFVPTEDFGKYVERGE
jgi:hypothetical protein